VDQQILQWIIIGITVAFVALEKASKLLKSNPGKYGERIATLEEAVKTIKEDIDHINRKLNGMK